MKKQKEQRVDVSQLKASDEIIQFLATYERYRKHMYDDGYGYPTIGWGHQITDPELASGFIKINGINVPWRKGLSKKQAFELKKQDLRKVERAVWETVKVPLHQREFDAICSLLFNIGTAWFTGAKGHKRSSIIKKLNKDDYDVFNRVAPLFRKSSGEISPGLIKRRADEVTIYKYGDYERDGK